MNIRNGGFTLIEVLVVVLIIGILAAVALPQYQKAVLKSRYSALMPIAKSLANGNEAYYLEHGVYATSPASLDVTGQADYPDGTQIDIQPDDSENASEEYNFVIASRDNNFPLNYLVYQNHSPKFAGNIHCEADENNTMAQEVCQSLGGELISGSQTEGFMTYVLSGAVGESDKLPSSLTKLAKQLCGNNANCEYEIDTQAKTVTLKECVDSSTSTRISTWCTNSIYGEDGDLLTTQQAGHSCQTESLQSHPRTNKAYVCNDKLIESGVSLFDRTESCYSSFGFMEDGKCVSHGPSVASLEQSYYYQVSQSDSKWFKACEKGSNGTCTADRVWSSVEVDGGGKKVAKYSCAGLANDDFSCSVYASYPEAARGTEYSLYNSVGKQTATWMCNTVNPSTGECTTLSSGYWNEYAADGTTWIASTGLSVSGDNITFTKKDASTQEVISTVTCLQTNANFETGTCKPGTAIE